MADEAAVVRCVACDRAIEACVCCDDPDCPRPICYPDLAMTTRESLPLPHTHGG